MEKIILTVYAVYFVQWLLRITIGGIPNGVKGESHKGPGSEVEVRLAPAELNSRIPEFDSDRSEITVHTVTCAPLVLLLYQVYLVYLRTEPRLVKCTHTSHSRTQYCFRYGTKNKKYDH